MKEHRFGAPSIIRRKRGNKMANCCITDYVFYSQNEKELERFHYFLSSLMDEALNDGFRITSNGRTTTYHEANYYFMQERLNIPENKMSSGCGSMINISQISNRDGFYYFNLSADDAWNPYPEIFDNVLKMRYTDIFYSYRAEETSGDVVLIHDDVGFFNEKYLLDGDLGGLEGFEDGVYKSFTDEESLISYLCRVLKMLSLKTGREITLTGKEKPLELVSMVKDMISDEFFFNLYEYNRV